MVEELQGSKPILEISPNHEQSTKITSLTNDEELIEDVFHGLQLDLSKN